jgi:hypothetical protein
VWYSRCCPHWRKYRSPAAHFLVLCYRTYTVTGLRPALRISTPQTRTCSFMQPYSATNQLTLRQRCYFQWGAGNGWRSIPCSGTRRCPRPRLSDTRTLFSLFTGGAVNELRMRNTTIVRQK